MIFPFLLIMDFYFGSPAFITQIFNTLAELEIAIVIRTNEANEEIDTQAEIVETKRNKVSM